MRGAKLRCALAAAGAAVLVACGAEPLAGGAPDEASSGNQIAGEDGGAGSADNGVNIDSLLESMEVGSRELYSARDAVVAAIGLRESDIVADIGAGTGLYSLLFADAAGADGHIYAVDIEPLFLDLINQRADDAGFANITAVLGRENDVTLPAESIDVAFIADTYHYFSDREAVMKSVFRALKPGGSLVLVDYDLQPGAARAPQKDHVRFGKAGVISEIEFIGFMLADEPVIEGLDENYFVRFRKP